jgi:hypothetical protein
MQQKSFKQKLREVESEENKILQKVHDATNEHLTPGMVISWAEELKKLRWQRDVIEHNLDEIGERSN